MVAQKDVRVCTTSGTKRYEYVLGLVKSCESMYSVWWKVCTEYVHR